MSAALPSDARGRDLVGAPPVPSAVWERLRDFILLGKPRLSLLVLVTTAGGLWIAPVTLPLWRTALTLSATALVVFAANALNCYLEREIDGRMRRTRERPLPAGRLEPQSALLVGMGAAALAVPLLGVAASWRAALLGLFAFASYVGAYTPLKQRTPWALLVGAVPGAIPPLLGYTAATNRIDAAGLSLFLLLFVWQLPHFLAIAVYLRDDYERGGLRVLSVVYGESLARRLVLASTALLLPVSLLLVPAGVADRRYALVAALLGAGLLGWTIHGMTGALANRWARRVFIGSLTYLTALFLSLVAFAT